jgi:hypothetical protein
MIKCHHGKDRCPYHRDVLVKWEIWGSYRGRVTSGKAVIVKPSKEGYVKVECNAMTKNGSCLKDWRPCPANEIIELLALKKRRE